MSHIRSILGRHGASLACLLVVSAGLAGAAAVRRPALALYLVSFLHYGLYWRAYAWGVTSFAAFKRDAIALKTLSVGALALVYLQAPLDPASLAVVALGILLNMRAAAAMGMDRTYYGHELAGLPPLRITAFPYSAIAHPMIAGNVLAFGGTLLNPAFRAAWGPLAILHVLLNLGLLAMELAGAERRRAIRMAGLAILAALATAAILFATREIP